jgi:hypothetical protein
MATAPTATGAGGPSMATMYGIGAAGNAVNAIMDGRGYRDMLGQQTQQLKNQIAFSRKILEKQKVLRDEEVIRQQMMARAAGDAFAASKAQFNNVEGDIGAKTNSIADTFRAVLARGGPESAAPAAKGPAAELEAALRSQQSAGIAEEAQNLAGAQAFGRTMTDKGYALNDQGTLAGLLRNFAQGSQQASSAEIASREGKLFQPQIIQPERSMIGDLLVGGSVLGMKAYDKMNQPKPENPYELFPGSGYSLNGGRSGIGLDPNANAGLGLRLSGTRTIGN